MEEASYKIKRVRWPPWSAEPRLVPVLLQDVNGPCPLIAILNVLMLRGTLTLPAAAGEISQARAVQMLAEHLLDTNFSRTEGAAAELRANLAHNLSDAIAQLPKLTTGIDVNVRFDGCRSLEFTGETAVFDLLGIDLVHGWLVDPQDSATAAAIGPCSYNELVLAIVAALGSDATPVASRRTSGHPAPQHAQAKAQPPQHAQKVDAETLAAALQFTLRVEIPDGPPTGMGAGDPRSRSTGGSSGSADSVAQAINRMVGDTVKEAFKTPTNSGRIGFSVTVPEDPALLSDASAAPTPAAGAPVVAADAMPPLIDLTEPAAEPAAAVAKESQGLPATPPPSAATTRLDLMAAESSDSINMEATAPSTTPPTATTPATEAATRDALLARDFLDQNPSQLTVYGLSSLMDDMSDEQLAVFFRNNHFNVLLKSGADLYILVTDQGYLYESDVVWEHLSNVDGDTELLGWDLRPFKAHAGAGGGGAAALDAAGDLGPEGVVNEDADFALAMQLQVEEEELARADEERRRAAAAARQQEQEQRQQRQGSRIRPPPTSGRQGSAGTRPGKSKKKTSDCSVM